MPASETWELTREQREWIGKLAESDGPEQLRIEVDGGLVYASVPRYLFTREPAQAWGLVLAARRLVMARATSREPEDRDWAFLYKDVPGYLVAVNQRFDKTPPPPGPINR